MDNKDNQAHAPPKNTCIVIPVELLKGMTLLRKIRGDINSLLVQSDVLNGDVFTGEAALYAFCGSECVNTETRF